MHNTDIVDASVEGIEPEQRVDAKVERSTTETEPEYHRDVGREYNNDNGHKNSKDLEAAPDACVSSCCKEPPWGKYRSMGFGISLVEYPRGATVRYDCRVPGGGSGSGLLSFGSSSSDSPRHLWSTEVPPPHDPANDQNMDSDAKGGVIGLGVVTDVGDVTGVDFVTGLGVTKSSGGATGVNVVTGSVTT